MRPRHLWDDVISYAVQQMMAEDKCFSGEPSLKWNDTATAAWMYYCDRNGWRISQQPDLSLLETNVQQKLEARCLVVMESLGIVEEQTPYKSKARNLIAETVTKVNKEGEVVEVNALRNFDKLTQKEGLKTRIAEALKAEEEAENANNPEPTDSPVDSGETTVSNNASNVNVDSSTTETPVVPVVATPAVVEAPKVVPQNNQQNQNKHHNKHGNNNSKGVNNNSTPKNDIFQTRG